MSSRREVLIRILALLQRNTLLETKIRTLKCVERHFWTVQSMKNVAVTNFPAIDQYFTDFQGLQYYM